MASHSLAEILLPCSERQPGRLDIVSRKLLDLIVINVLESCFIAHLVKPVTTQFSNVDVELWLGRITNRGICVEIVSFRSTYYEPSGGRDCSVTYHTMAQSEED